MSAGRTTSTGRATSEVLRHVIEAITPASEAHRAAALRKLHGAGPLLDRLGGQLAAAQHGPPRAGRRLLVIAAGDHGAADPGIALGDAHPTVVAAHAIDGGEAAVCQLARGARAELLMLDCGCTEAPRLPASMVRVGRRPSGDLRQAAAMTIVETTAALEAGIAVAVALLDGERGLDVLAIGALGLGAEMAAAAITGALLGPEHLPPPAALASSGGLAGPTLADEDRDLAAFAHRRAREDALDAFGVLAAFGGPELATLAGILLAAASMNLPIILDGEATAAAALVAARLAPPLTGYLIAAQHGHGCAPAILAALDLAPVFAGGVGHGEGAAAAMVLGLLDAALAPWRPERP